MHLKTSSSKRLGLNVINMLRSEQDTPYFSYICYISKHILLFGCCGMSIQMPLKYAPKELIDNKASTGWNNVLGRNMR